MIEDRVLLWSASDTQCDEVFIRRVVENKFAQLKNRLAQLKNQLAQLEKRSAQLDDWRTWHFKISSDLEVKKVVSKNIESFVSGIDL